MEGAAKEKRMYTAELGIWERDLSGFERAEEVKKMDLGTWMWRDPD